MGDDEPKREEYARRYQERLLDSPDGLAEAAALAGASFRAGRALLFCRRGGDRIWRFELRPSIAQARPLRAAVKGYSPHIRPSRRGFARNKLTFRRGERFAASIILPQLGASGQASMLTT
ncbi:MAG TPA: hypothetical protein VGR42_14625 [Casimicrobiaceae bacterium]|nr:hypothetical protein [Casimicrobiaceae bacterium]